MIEVFLSTLLPRAVVVAVDNGLLASDVLSTLPKPTSDLVTVTSAVSAWPLTVLESGTPPRPLNVWSPVFVPDVLDRIVR